MTPMSDQINTILRKYNYINVEKLKANMAFINSTSGVICPIIMTSIIWNFWD